MPIVGIAFSVAAMSEKDSLLEGLSRLLLEHGYLSSEALARGEEVAARTNVRLPAALTRLGLLSEAELSDAFSTLLEIPRIGRDVLVAPKTLPDDLNPVYLKSKRVLPISISNDHVELAMADPLDEAALSAVQFAFQKPVFPVVAEESDIEEVLAELVNVSEANDEQMLQAGANDALQINNDLSAVTDRDSDAPVIRLVTRLVAKAVTLHASDIHIEPQADSLVVRFRVDGDLGDQEIHAKRLADPVVSRIKLMAKLDIAEKRLPQDGRAHTSVRGNAIELRIATFPTLNGESVVVRILGQLDVDLELDKVGLTTSGLLALKESLGKPNGLILITGPTGSGKTTTLYAALNEVRRPNIKMVTVEDPVEYSLPGISQLQVKPEIGLTFANALRSVLRNDPDIIMVGEIRDKETADIAIRAALTGHLVLATLHTNTAAGAITRLLDLGIEDFLLSSVLLLASAQRLVRRVCQDCGTWSNIDDTEGLYLEKRLGVECGTLNHSVRIAGGCERCNWKGYKGRIPLFEAIPISNALRSMIDANFDEAAFEDAARLAGAKTLFADGVLQACTGMTTIEEVLSVVGR